MNWNVSDYIKENKGKTIFMGLRSGKKFLVSLIEEDKNFILARFIRETATEKLNGQIVFSKNSIAYMYEPKQENMQNDSPDYVQSVIRQVEKDKGGN